MDESSESNEQADSEIRDTEAESAFEPVPVGAGCVEIWERLAEHREDD